MLKRLKTKWTEFPNKRNSVHLFIGGSQLQNIEFAEGEKHNIT